MKKALVLIISFSLLLLTACGAQQQVVNNTNQTPSTSINDVQISTQTTTEPTSPQIIDYPKIEEISWEFRNTVRYNEPVAAFDYTNNSNYTIVRMQLEFRMKDGVTSEQLQLTYKLTGELVTDEEIPEMEPYVIDWIVCDPGETAEGAVLYMMYNTEPSNTAQCDLMELTSALIYYIAEDGKIHNVSYSAENGGYSLSEKSEEPYIWIDNEYTRMIPIPNSRIVEAEQYKETALSVDAYDITHDAYLEYIKKCQDMGFVDTYPDEDHDYTYFGTYAESYEIYIRYIEHMNHMEITLEKLDTE